MLFLVWPLLSFTLCVANYKDKHFKNFLWLFCVFFGFTFVISNEGLDAAVYRDWLIGAHAETTSFAEHLSFSQDYFNTILTYFVAQFTGDYRVLFAFYGLVFGYFYSRNLSYFISKIKRNNHVLILIVLLFFALIIPFWKINGFRFFTATQILLYCLIQILLEKRSKYFLLAFLIPLVHFSFVFPVAVLVLTYFVKPFLKLYWGFFFASLFLVELDLTSILTFLPTETIYEEKIIAYTHEQYVEKIQKATNNASWFLYNRTHLMTYVFLFFSFYIVFFKNKLLQNEQWVKFLSFGLLLHSISLLLSIIPSMDRYIVVSQFALAGFLLLFIGKYIHLYWMKRQLPLYILPMLLYIVVEVRLSLQYIGLNTLFSNPMIAWAIENETALINFYPF